MGPTEEKKKQVRSSYLSLIQDQRNGIFYMSTYQKLNYYSWIIRE